MCVCMDNYFGPRRYGYRFEGETVVYSEEELTALQPLKSYPDDLQVAPRGALLNFLQRHMTRLDEDTAEVEETEVEDTDDAAEGESEAAAEQLLIKAPRKVPYANNYCQTSGHSSQSTMSYF